MKIAILDIKCTVRDVVVLKIIALFEISSLWVFVCSGASGSCIRSITSEFSRLHFSFYDWCVCANHKTKKSFNCSFANIKYTPK